MSTLAVIVPTFRRPQSLAACLDALAAQRRAPDEIVVVSRTDDPQGTAVARARAPWCTVLELDDTGVLAAMAAGVRATSADVVCFTDDDARVPAEWTERIAAAFDERPLLGALGGRDRIVDEGGLERKERLTEDVGRVTWYGRHVGNHHLGTGEPRAVGFLKGVNAAYRRAALALPIGLRGKGAQVHYEVAIGRFVASRGWSLCYDPTLVVEHRPAPREGEDQRDAPSRAAVADAAYNLVVAIGGAKGLLRVAYATAVGDRGAPGIGRAALAAMRGDRATAGRLGASLSGTLAGGAALLRRRGVSYETFD